VRTYPWDAGTDAGQSYDAPDRSEDPLQSVTRIRPNDGSAPTSGAFVSFDDLRRQAVVNPVGEFSCVLHVCPLANPDCKKPNWPPANGCDVLKYPGCENWEECFDNDDNTSSKQQQYQQQQQRRVVLRENCCAAGLRHVDGVRCDDIPKAQEPPSSSDLNDDGGLSTSNPWYVESRSSSPSSGPAVTKAFLSCVGSTVLLLCSGL